MFARLGWMEIGLIVLVVVLIFGAGKLKGLGKAAGESIREFKKGIKDDEQPEEPKEKE